MTFKFPKGIKGFIMIIIGLIILCVLFSGYLWSSSSNIQDNSISLQIINTIEVNLNKFNDIHSDLTQNKQDMHPIQNDPDIIIPCYLLHKTHKLTPYIIDRMKSAKQQIEQSNCKYIILYWIDTPIISTNQSNEISQLQTIFDDETVFVVDTINTNKTFPNLLPFMFSLNLDWLTPETWAWNMADVPELVWYDHNRDKIMNDEERLNESVWIWMMEYDIGWKGNLGEILMDTFTKKSKATYLGYNYNGPKLMKWTHIYKRYNVPNYTDDGIYNCLIQLIRYTAFIMDKMIEQINNKEIIYCECRGIMLCRDFESDGCIIEDMQKLFTKNFGWFYSGTTYKKDKWFDSIAYNDSEWNKLYHRLKW